MIESVGNEFMKAAMGLGSQDAYIVAYTTQQLLKDKAAMQSAQQIYGPQHKSVRELAERIRVTEQYLANRRAVQMAALQRASNEQLAPMLLRIARQQLEQAMVHEQNLRASFDAERGRALELDVSATRLETVENELDHLVALKQALVERLKEIDLDQGNGMLKTKVIKAPEAPKHPSNPQLVKTFAIAVFLGLAFSLALIYILDLLDDRFRSPEEMHISWACPSWQ